MIRYICIRGLLLQLYGSYCCSILSYNNLYILDAGSEPAGRTGYTSAAPLNGIWLPYAFLSF